MLSVNFFFLTFGNLFDSVMRPIASIAVRERIPQERSF